MLSFTIMTVAEDMPSAFSSSAEAKVLLENRRLDGALETA